MKARSKFILFSLCIKSVRIVFIINRGFNFNQIFTFKSNDSGAISQYTNRVMIFLQHSIDQFMVVDVATAHILREPDGTMHNVGKSYKGTPKYSFVKIPVPEGKSCMFRNQTCVCNTMVHEVTVPGPCTMRGNSCKGTLKYSLGKSETPTGKSCSGTVLLCMSSYVSKKSQNTK